MGGAGAVPLFITVVPSLESRARAETVLFQSAVISAPAQGTRALSVASRGALIVASVALVCAEEAARAQ